MMRVLPPHLKKLTIFTNAAAPCPSEMSVEDFAPSYNYMQNQLHSPQPKNQTIVLDVKIEPITETVLVDTREKLTELKDKVNSESFVLI
jgi:hypothetical protein